MTNTINQKEIEQFSSISNKWWNKTGPFAALHKMSNARIEFITRNAKRIVDQKQTEIKLLKNLHCLDVGCGGGILSEPFECPLSCTPSVLATKAQRLDRWSERHDLPHPRPYTC